MFPPRRPGWRKRFLRTNTATSRHRGDRRARTVVLVPVPDSRHTDAAETPAEQSGGGSRRGRDAIGSMKIVSEEVVARLGVLERAFNEPGAARTQRLVEIRHDALHVADLQLVAPFGAPRV